MFAFENPSYRYSFAPHSVQHQYFLDFHFEEHNYCQKYMKIISDGFYRIPLSTFCFCLSIFSKDDCYLICLNMKDG